MKRQPGSMSKKDTNKRQKLSSNCDQLDAEAICEIRRKEIFEIIAEENRLASKVPKNDASLTINNEKFYKVISRDKVKLTLSMLKEEKKQPKHKTLKEEKRFAILKKHCNKNVWHFNMQEPDHTWDSSMYIIKNIRSCILTRNWNNLTRLLLMLLKYRKAYIPFIKQTDNGHLQTVTPQMEEQVLNEIEDNCYNWVSLLNFMCNPKDNGEILEDFFELFASHQNVQIHR